MLKIASNNTNIVFWMSLLVLPLVGLGIDIHVPSLPSIIHYFHAPQASVQASVTWYVLGYGVGQLLLGTLSDSLGRRKLLLTCLLIYSVACMSSIVSPSIHLFLASRLLQGLVVAGPAIAAKSSISDCFKGKKLHKVSTYLSMVISIGPIIAPALGGYFQHYLGWQACFYFLAIYSVIIFVGCFLLFPETIKKKEVFHIKVITLNYMQVLTNPVFVGSVICAGLFFSVLAVFNVMGPFIIQTSLHFTAIQFGHAALLLGGFTFTGALLNRWLLHYFEPHTILIGGICYMVMLSLAAVIISPHVPFSFWWLMIPLMLLYIAVGLLTPCVFGIALGLFPHLGGTANALRGVGMMVLTALMTLTASQFSTLTQMPLVYFYFAISVGCLLAYLFLMRVRRRS